MSQFLFQPAVKVNGSTCFVANEVVCFLAKCGRFTLPEILKMDFSIEDKLQYMQLLGMELESFRELVEERWTGFSTLQIAGVAERIADGKGVLESRLEQLEAGDSMSRCRGEDINLIVSRLHDEIARLWQAIHDRDDR